MPISAAASSPSPSTIPPPRPDVPRVLAVLDLHNPEELAARDLVQEFCAGVRPKWRLLGVQRSGSVLRAAVEWVRRTRARYSVAEVSLTSSTITWASVPSAAEALGQIRAVA